MKTDGRGGTRRAQRGNVQRALAYMRRHYAERTSLSDLARAAGCSKFHLCRTFRAEMGVPPYAYLQRWRILRAQELLGRGMPLSEVALAVGFADQSHFGRCFKKVTGLTPGEFAAARRASALVLPGPQRYLRSSSAAVETDS